MSTIHARKPSRLNRLMAGTVLCTLLSQIAACNFLQSDQIDNSMSSLASKLNSESRSNPSDSGAAQRAQWANDVVKVAREMNEAVNAAPKLEGKLGADLSQAEEYVRANQPRVAQWLSGIEAKSKQMREIIFAVSKNSYESGKASDIARNSAILVHALHYERNVYRGLIGAATPLMLGSSVEGYEKSQTVASFRKFLMDNLMTYLGMTKVIEHDISETIAVIAGIKDQAGVPAYVVKLVNSVQSEVLLHERDGKTKMAKALSNLSSEERAAVNAQVKSYEDQLSTKTLLYTPGANSNELVNLLTIVGNLTWGLVNTLIGLGIVVATIVVSPFSDSVDFPTFRIAANGRQIYVNCTGMGAMTPTGGGKLSMGLFELDSGNGYYGSSGHEGAHAIQSAILGPLYLPVILGSYMISGFDQGFMEAWADAWAGI